MTSSFDVEKLIDFLEFEISLQQAYYKDVEEIYVKKSYDTMRAVHNAKENAYEHVLRRVKLMLKEN